MFGNFNNRFEVCSRESISNRRHKEIWAAADKLWRPEPIKSINVVLRSERSSYAARMYVLFNLILAYITTFVVCVDKFTRTRNDDMYHCPMHADGDVNDWPCVRRADLCNGQNDCPHGHDENPILCMFWKAVSFECEIMRHSVLSNEIFVKFEQISGAR